MVSCRTIEYAWPDSRGLRQTQELLDFCARSTIQPDCELIRIKQINDAFERLARADVHYRFVIDMATL